MRKRNIVSEQHLEVIVPVEQAIIHFYDHDIIAVRLPDGRIAAALNGLCDAVQLDRWGQTERIREDEVLSEQLLPA